MTFFCFSPLYDIIECFEVLSDFCVLQVCVCVHAKSANISGLPCSCSCIQYLKKKKGFSIRLILAVFGLTKKKYQIFVKNFHSLPPTFCTVCFLLQSSKQIINWKINVDFFLLPKIRILPSIIYQRNQRFLTEYI